MFPASTNLFVIAISSLLGSKFPLGWLCIKNMLALLLSIAVLKTSLGWTMLELRFPTDITSYLMIWLEEFKQTTRNFSLFSSLRTGINNSAKSSGEVILTFEERQKSRYKAELADGRALGWFLERGIVLSDGKFCSASPANA